METEYGILSACDRNKGGDNNLPFEMGEIGSASRIYNRQRMLLLQIFETKLLNMCYLTPHVSNRSICLCIFLHVLAQLPTAVLSFCTSYFVEKGDVTFLHRLHVERLTDQL